MLNAKQKFGDIGRVPVKNIRTVQNNHAEASLRGPFSLMAKVYGWSMLLIVKLAETTSVG